MRTEVGTIRLEGRARDKLSQKPFISKGCVYLLDHEIENYKISSGVHHHTPPLSHTFSSGDSPLPSAGDTQSPAVLVDKGQLFLKLM